MKSLPKRTDVREGDTWDLRSLFASDTEWDEALLEWEKRIPLFRDYVGTLGESAEKLAQCLVFDLEIDREADRLGTYAHLRMSEDTAATPAQRMMGRFQHAATKAGELASFLQPEIIAIQASVLEGWLEEPVLQPFRLMLQRVVRNRPHVLSEPEERILAMQGTFAGTAGKVFRQLTDADMKFGTIADGKGNELELSNATFTTLLHDSVPEVRKSAFHQYHAQ